MALAGLITASCGSDAPVTDPEFRSQIETASLDQLPQTIADKAEAVGVTGAAITMVEGGSDPVTFHIGRSAPGLQLQAASMSKAVAAAVILTVAQQKGVGLDDDIRGQMPSTKPRLDMPEDRPLTLRQLLSSTSGASVHGFNGYAIGEELPSTMEIVADPPGWFESAVNFDGAPGQFSYSGGGYMVAQLWAENAAQEGFPSLAKRLILEPLAMNDSTFEQTSQASQAQRDARVGADDDGLDNSWNNYPEHAAAGLWTTSEDYAKFAMALLDAASGASSEISEEVAKAMISPQVQLQGQTHYGLGTQLFLNEDETVKYVSHSGGNLGYRTLFSSSPANEERPARVVVSLTNTPAGMGFNQDVVYGLMARKNSAPELSDP
jgi:CubicO group peptidase (beta-lactamase class C family)